MLPPTVEIVMAEAPPFEAPLWENLAFSTFIDPVIEEDPYLSNAIGKDSRELLKITRPDDAMTIEGWMNELACYGEQALFTECETLVSRFEREGQRALHVLEAMEVVG